MTSSMNQNVGRPGFGSGKGGGGGGGGNENGPERSKTEGNGRSMHGLP